MSDAKTHAPKEAGDPSMEEILATIRKIITEDEQKAGSEASSQGRTGQGSETSEDHGVLVLTEAVEEDGSLKHIQPVVDAIVPPAHQGRVEPEPPRPDVPPEHVSGEPVFHTERRISTSASGLAAAALARLTAENERLTAEIAQRNDVPLGGAGKTLEGVVREALQPVLKAWLDENLPRIVEPLVRAEVARVVAENNSR